MDFAIERDELLQGLYLTQGIVERRTTIPILANVLFESSGDGIVVAATDQEIGVRRTCIGSIKKPGAMTTAARKLYEIVKECPSGPIQFRSLENNWISVTAGKSRFKIVGLDPQEFPAMPAPKAGEAEHPPVRMPAPLLRELISRTLFAVSQDDTRANLSGIFLECPEAGRVRAVATDGHRLSMITRSVDGVVPSDGVILPRKGVNEIVKIIEGSDEDIELTLDGGLAHTSIANVEFSMRLVEGDFPDYRQVVPQSTPRVMALTVGDFLSALKRVSVVSSDRTRGIKLNIEAGRLEISSSAADFGEAVEELTVEYEGESFSVGYNAKYLIDVLTILPGESTVEMCFRDDISPGLLRAAGDPDFVYVVMPMRL